MARRRKPPLPRDMALWEQVKESVQPLRKERLPEPHSMEDLLKVREEPKRALARQRPTPAPAPKLVKPPGPPPLAPIEPSFRRALRRGSEAIEGRLDLHGMTLAQAHGVLHGFLHRSRAEGKRLVLVITGKGRGDAEGVLKRTVPQWLAEPNMRAIVLGFESAARHHGGTGALYVRLRRARGRT